MNVGIGPLGTRPRSFISGNICFEFSVLCLSSGVHLLILIKKIYIIYKKKVCVPDVGRGAG
jgi:hypothetical protein